MKITRETVLAQMGHHRTHLDDICKGLGLNRSGSLLKMLCDFRVLKFCWIMICLLVQGVIDSDSDRHEYWITF